ncbi:hypothetical protein ACSMAE_003093 [Cronobacter sakazakii]
MENYYDSAVRHYLDAKRLQDAGSSDNAGHLIGFAAECAIKYKIHTLTPTVDNPRVHLPDIVNAAIKRLQSRSEQSMLSLLKRGILSGWDVNKRYHSNGHVLNSELSQWITDTRRLLATANIKVHIDE